MAKDGEEEKAVANVEDEQAALAVVDHLRRRGPGACLGYKYRKNTVVEGDKFPAFHVYHQHRMTLNSSDHSEAQGMAATFIEGFNAGVYSVTRKA